MMQAGFTELIPFARVVFGQRAAERCLACPGLRSEPTQSRFFRLRFGRRSE